MYSKNLNIALSMAKESNISTNSIDHDYIILWLYFWTLDHVVLSQEPRLNSLNLLTMCHRE